MLVESNEEAISVQNGNFFWKKENLEEEKDIENGKKKYLFEDFSIKFEKGKLTALIGK